MLSGQESIIPDKYSGLFLNVSYLPNGIKNVEGLSISDKSGTTLAFRALDEILGATLFGFYSVFEDKIGTAPSYIEMEDNRQIVSVKDDNISMHVMFNEYIDKDNAKSVSRFLLAEFNRFYKERLDPIEEVAKYDQFFGLVGLLI